MNIYTANRALFSFFMLTAASAAFAGNSATITLSATVLAECTISMDKSTLELGRITVSNLAGRPANDALDGMTGTVTVTSKCDGSTNARMTVSTQTVADNNIVASSPSGNSDTDIMRFGLKIDDVDANFNDSTKTVTKEISDQKLSSSGHTDSLEFSALAGASASKATAGSYSATVTVRVEPE